MRIRKQVFMGLVAVALGLCPAGCGDNTAEQVGAMNTSNIQRIGNIYAGFQNYKGNKGPKDEAEFKTFIKEYDPGKLKMMKIDPAKVDELFTSERDGKPFKVRYGVGGGRGSSDPVVFEQEGKDGKKQVGYTGGKVEEVDDATYQKLWGKGSAPAAVSPKPGGPPAEGSGRPQGRPGGAPAGPPG
jgi:hypothetical protein